MAGGRATATRPEPVQPQPEPSKPETTPAGDPAPEPVQPQPVPAQSFMPDAVGYYDGELVRFLPDGGFEPIGPRPLGAAAALAQVMRLVQPIAKDRQADAKAGGYKFRGIDDLYGALHDLMADVGLVVLPRPIERLREQRSTSSGGTNHVTSLLVEFTFLAADGSREVCSAWGEGGDTGDKSTQKAHSQAIKSALLEVFLIPTEQSAQDDPDATNVEPGRTVTAEEVKRAGNAYEAALNATTVEQLAGIRQRAVALLGVPVAMANGDLIPLAVLFDSRRTAIERPIDQPA